MRDKRMSRFALLMAAVMAIGFLSACGGDDDVITPTERGPVTKAVVTTPTGYVIPANSRVCLWIESQEECEGSDIPREYWFQSPDAEPERATVGMSPYNDLLFDLFMWRIMYDMWFGSPAYYTVYMPASYHEHYKTRASKFRSAYKTRIDANVSKAQYRNSAGKIFSGNKIDPKRFASRKNNGGDRFRKCNALVWNSLGGDQSEVMNLDALLFANRTLDALNPTSQNFGNFAMVVTGRGGGSSSGGRSGSSTGSKSTTRSGTSSGGSKSTTSNTGGDRGKGARSTRGC